MKVVKIQEREVHKLQRIADSFYEIYGDENNEDRKWSFQNVEDMRELGQDFIEIVMLCINKD